MHSIERIYLRQWCFDDSKPRIDASTGAQYRYVGFSRHNKIPRCSAYDSKPRVATATSAQYWFSRCNKILDCSAYAMGETNPVPTSGLSIDHWQVYEYFIENGFQQVFSFSNRTYFVQLLYLGILSRPKYHEFSLTFVIFPMLQY